MVTLIAITALLVTQVTMATAQVSDFFFNCTSSPTSTQNSTYQSNLNNLLTILTSNASLTGFHSTSYGQTPDQVYGLYLCRGDMESQRCSECVYQAHNTIMIQCISPVQAVIWYQNCTLRFTNESLFGRMDAYPRIILSNSLNIPSNDTRVFIDVLNNTMKDLASQVANSTIKYGTRMTNITSLQNLYALGQCTPDLTTADCSQCLMTAIPHLLHMIGGRVLQPSCIVWYDVVPFYSQTTNESFFLPPCTNSTETSPKEKRKRLSKTVLAVSIPVILGLLLTFGAFYCARNRKKTDLELSTELDEIKNAESLLFDFKKIRDATENFSLDNKLGEGGFGAVYKGRLEDGQQIAVKRLSTNSGQGIKEFKTEVLLVAKLQHKNLVKLLGFCLLAKEKLLVYELLPNSSLDKALLDPDKQQSLDWEARYKIIAGVARGLLYLHEDSRLKIIHRDLKSSNILLDENMDPKISDFGLAKLVRADQIQSDTNRIVGTYGYMSPEYAMAGRFSVKSDVYSFGVIVLEIVSGHKCNSSAIPFREDSLLDRAWMLWNANTVLDIVDPRLGGNFSSDEVSTCIHIALLCIQEDARLRPTMAPIVSVLNGHPVALPVPVPPRLMTITNSSGQTSSTFSGSRDIISEVYTR